MNEVVQLSGSADLLSELAKRCEDAAVDTGWIRARGRAESLRLTVNGQTVLDVDEGVDIASFDGSWRTVDGAIVVNASAVASALVGGSTLIAAGTVAAASGFHGELFLQPSGAHAVAPMAAAGPSQSETSEPKTASPWDRVAQASADLDPVRERAEKNRPAPTAEPVVNRSAPPLDDDDDEDEIDVEDLARGAIIMHPQLGACRVLSVLSDDAIKVRLPNGKARKLMMRVFTLHADENGQYSLRKRD